MWITSLIRKTFFKPCSIHEKTKNQQKFYCIDCDSIVCQYCISTDPHNQHKFLRIHRYSYTDAIRVKDIKQHFDCSQIQHDLRKMEKTRSISLAPDPHEAYRCNGHKVNVLNPLPSSKAKRDKDDCCNSCQRKLFEAKLYSYCSIACQVAAISRELNAQDSSHCVAEAPMPNRNKQPRRSSSSRRKGIPHRAPIN